MDCEEQSKGSMRKGRHQLRRRSRKVHPTVIMVQPTDNQHESCSLGESTRDSHTTVARRPPSSLRPQSQLWQRQSFHKTLPSVAACPLQSSLRAQRTRNISRPGTSLSSQGSRLDTPGPSTDRCEAYLVNMRPPTRNGVGYDLIFEPARRKTRPTLSKSRVLSDSPSSSLCSLTDLSLSDLELSPSPSFSNLECLTSDRKDSVIVCDYSRSSRVIDDENMSESDESENESECSKTECLIKVEIDPKLLFGPSYKESFGNQVSSSPTDSVSICSGVSLSENEQTLDLSDGEESSEYVEEVTKRKNPNASRWDGGRYFTSRKPPLHPSVRRRVFGSLEKLLFF